MPFEGGPINTLGITPSFVTGLATVATQSSVAQAAGQIWQGVGQSFAGQAGQALLGNVAGSAINIALNNSLGTSVVGPSGLSLADGQNFLASAITPYVTSSTAAGLNQTIQQTLQSAGPFGNLLSQVGTGLVNQVFQGIGNTLLQGTIFSQNFKMFPGAGDEPAADYGGSAYTLGPNGKDVVFSLQPANQGPQLSGLANALNDPKALTKISSLESLNVTLKDTSAAANIFKQTSMGIYDIPNNFGSQLLS